MRGWSNGNRDDVFDGRLDRAVGMVLEQQHEHGSQWAAMESIAAKIGCAAEMLRKASVFLA